MAREAAVVANYANVATFTASHLRGSRCRIQTQHADSFEVFIIDRDGTESLLFLHADAVSNHEVDKLRSIDEDNARLDPLPVLDRPRCECTGRKEHAAGRPEAVQRSHERLDRLRPTLLPSLYLLACI